MSDDAGWLRQFLEALLGGAGRSVAPSAPAIAPVLTGTASMAMLLTPSLLQQLGAADPDLWAPALANSCLQQDIATPLRLAAFLANILTETGGFQVLVENFNYTPQALLKQWPKHFTPALADRLGRTDSHPADQQAIAETAYGGRMGNRPAGSGDGWLYRGRGLIQLTGRDAYSQLADPLGIQLPELPTYVVTHDGAARSAALDWASKGCNRAADAGDIVTVRRLVNGGDIGLDAVTLRYAAACRLLNVS